MAKYTLTRPMWTGDKTLYREGTREVSAAHAKELGLDGSATAESQTAGSGGSAGGEAGTYPYADLLAPKFKTWEEVQAASDEDLIAINGIGPARVKEIRDWKPGA